MTERTVRVRVVADNSQFNRGMRTSAGEATAFGTATTRAGRATRAMSGEATAARGGLNALGAGARGGAAATREAEAAALAAGRGVRAAGGAAAASGPAFTRMGTAARSGFGAVRSGADSALGSVKHLGLLLAGGAILFGLHDIVHAGNEYTDSMNKFLEVTRASGAQMASAGREAQALGADMKLPSANASEAADAMVDLAKAGLSAQDAIKAARGTIQLAAAARTDVATSAQIEGDVMDQFSLKSSEAAHVADVLANTSNSASGQLMDIYYAMKYVGPIAHTMGVSLKDTATAVGLLGKSGIIGETAGTALRSALVNMAKPTKLAQKGLHELGIEAFDSQGNFKGLQYVISQLGVAQEHLTTQQFTAAAAMAFGKPALSAMVALAHQGGTAFEQFGVQVGRVGGAAALAAAESKGLGGAMRGLGKQISSAFLQVYRGISPGLEKITRGMTSSVSSAIPYIKSGIRIAGDLWDIYGPSVEAKLHAASAGVGRAAADLAVPLKAALAGGAVATVPLAVTSVQSLEKVLHNASAAAAPLTSGLHDLFGSVSSGAGALGVLSGRLQVGVGVLGDMSAVLRPIGELVGGLAHAFAGLPGPIQLSVLAMLAMRPFRPQIQGMQNAVTGFGRAGINAFRGIGDASLYQRVQAANSFVTLGRFGGVMAELEQRSPAIAAMGNSFRTTSASIQTAGGRLVGFRSAAGGAMAAIGTGAGRGLLGASRSLYGFLGGPWGIAIAGAMIGLDLLAKRQQEAAAAAAAHQQRISSLTQALQQSSGAIDGNVRAAAVQTLADAKLKDGKTALLDVMASAGVSATQLTNAYLGQGDSVGALQKRLLAAAKANTFFVSAAAGPSYFGLGKQYQVAGDALGSLNGEVPAAIQKQKELAAAVKGSGDASLDATNPTGRLQAAIDTLGKSESDASTKASALHTALQLLSGGELDVEAAVATMNQSMLDLNSAWKEGVKHSDGYGKALLQVDGSLNTTSANGQTLWTKLQSLNESTAGAAQSTYDYARANGTAVVPALKQAEARMETAYQAAVKAGRAFGLNADQAKELAVQMGFIPSSLAITMSTPGLSDTQKQLLYVQGLAGHMAKGSVIKVSALTDEATKAIESVGFKVKTLPGGRQMEITAPTGKAAAGLDALIAKKLPAKVLGVDAKTAAATSALNAVKAKLASVPHGKSITVSAPSAAVISALQSIGFKVRTLPNHKISITVPTNSAFNSTRAIQNYVNRVHGKTVPINIYYKANKVPGAGTVLAPNANGAVYKAYASGGLEDHTAQIARPGTWRVWAEDETGGESYIPLAPSKRKRSRAIAEETVKRLGGGPVMWYANGGITYTPSGAPALGGPTDAMTRYNDQTGRLAAAWKALNAALADARKKTTALHDAENNLRRVRSHKHTEAQLTAAEIKLRNARDASNKANSKVSADRKTVNSLDSALGLKNGSKAPAGFNLKAYQVELGKSVAATAKWQAGLSKIAGRGGSEIESILENMGTDGYNLVNALAKANDKQFNDITAKLLKTAGIAKASLADFDKQVNASTKANAQFSADLQKLAAAGYGDLAQSLAAQGDDAAMAIAHQAAGSSSGAAAANAAVQANAATLTGGDLTNAITLLSTLKGGSGRGYADLIAAGLDVGTIKALVPKMTAQIKALPAEYKDTFVRQWVQQGGVAMAQGGILNAPTVLAGEAGPEAYIPLNQSMRSRSLLATTAAALGYHLVPASRYASSGSSTPAPAAESTRTVTVNLNGAKQSTAEQAMDVARYVAHVG